jgi:hypothetical protein
MVLTTKQQRSHNLREIERDLKIASGQIIMSSEEKKERYRKFKRLGFV